MNTSIGVRRTSRLSLPARKKNKSRTRIPTCLPKSANLFNRFYIQKSNKIPCQKKTITWSEDHVYYQHGSVNIAPSQKIIK